MKPLTGVIHRGNVLLVGRSGATTREGHQMFIATDTTTNYLAVLVAQDVQERGAVALDDLYAQGWSLARIDAYCRRGAELVAA